MTARPNFFIVGAPKAGTTAMYAYLAMHPDVFMPERKEPSYFAADLDERTRGADRWFVRDLDAYLALFSGWCGQRRVGEASTMYLYSEVAARAIQRFEPQARIIAMLREPVEAMYALHAQKFKSGSEDIKGFEAALAAEADRAAGHRVPKWTNMPKALQYRKVVSYADQVARYLDTFPSDQVLVLIFEEFVSSPGSAYRQVCEFLDIDASTAAHLPPVNENARPRSLLVRNLLRSHPKRIAGRRPPRLARKVWSGVLKPAVTAMNTEVTPREALDPRLRSALVAELAPDVARLGRLLGRDLSACWGYPA
jgi:hypothetical protein